MAIQKSSRKTAKKDDRTRNWTFVVYPESAPANWRDVLDEQHTQWIESPLHDKDENADGTQKKAHWHVLMLYEGKKSFEQIKELTDVLNQPIPQKVASAKGLVRYMAHLDNPEKVQYAKEQIIGHGGVDVAEYLKPPASARYAQLREMREWVRNNSITEFYQLFDYAAEHRFDDWFPLLCDNSAYIMGEYIKSLRHGYSITEEPSVVKVNPETGEVIE